MLNRAVPGLRGLRGRLALLPADLEDQSPEPDSAAVDQDVPEDQQNKSHALNKLLAPALLATSHHLHAIPVTHNRLSL